MTRARTSCEYGYRTFVPFTRLARECLRDRATVATHDAPDVGVRDLGRILLEDVPRRPSTAPRGVGRCSCQRRTEARMYVRVARFEGVDPSRADAMVEEMHGQMDAMRRGETPEGIPAEAVAALRDDITERHEPARPGA
jgi:hypothetical protein